MVSQDHASGVMCACSDPNSPMPKLLSTHLCSTTFSCAEFHQVVSDERRTLLSVGPFDLQLWLTATWLLYKVILFKRSYSYIRSIPKTRSQHLTTTNHHFYLSPSLPLFWVYFCVSPYHSWYPRHSIVWSFGSCKCQCSTYIRVV